MAYEDEANIEERDDVTLFDPIQMLLDDHEIVLSYFKEFEEARDDEEKRELMQLIFTELTIHTALEEELFYPAVFDETGDENLISHAVDEHQQVKDLLVELQTMSPGDERFAPSFSQLVEMVSRHIEEEEKEMLPRASKSDLDRDLGLEMLSRREELEGRMDDEDMRDDDVSLH